MGWAAAASKPICLIKTATSTLLFLLFITLTSPCFYFTCFSRSYFIVPPSYCCFCSCSWSSIPAVYSSTSLPLFLPSVFLLYAELLSILYRSGCHSCTYFITVVMAALQSSQSESSAKVMNQGLRALSILLDDLVNFTRLGELGACAGVCMLGLWEAC